MQNSSFCHLPPLWGKSLVKSLLIMKITAILLLSFLFHANANIHSQNISISVSNASIEKVFKEIENQTGYGFVYAKEQIANISPVSLKIVNGDLKYVLNNLLSGQKLTYQISGLNIIIKEIPKEKEIIFNVSPPPFTVTGKVVDNDGNPLEGVAIILKSNKKGVTTSKDGSFTVQVPQGGDILLFSYVGYESQELKVFNKTSLNIILKQSDNKVDEVVVIGYGTTKKKDVTAAIAKVNVEDLQKAPVMSFDMALAGRTTGVQVVSRDGQPGAPVNIVIRGNNSLTQDNSPLYVIDGFPIENPDNNVINPAEIESLEILKDASATSIYGARGANGVILITTKKGKIGPPKVEFEVYRSTQKVIQRMELMTPYDYVQYLYELNPTNTLATYLRNVPNDPVLVDSVMNTYKKIKGADFQDAVFGQPAPFLNLNLSVRGGNDKTRYSTSVNYANQEGVVINSGYKRYQFKLNLDQTISNKLKVGLNSTITFTNQYGVQPVGSGTSGLAGGTSYLMASVWGYRPVSYSGNIDSLLDLPNDVTIDPLNTSSIYNPLYSTKNEYHQNNQLNLFANGYLDYQIVRGLKLRVSAGVNQTSLRRENFYNSQTSRGRITATNPNGVNGDYSILNTTSITNENTLTYNTNIKNDHHLNVLAGFTNQSNITKTNAGSATNIPNESLGMSGLSQGIAGTPVVGSTENTLISLLSRVQYDYKSKYLVTGSIRADASSKFSEENKWSYFPSFSFAWRFSKEKFMDKLGFIDDAKIRFGHGTTGNNRVSDFVTYSSLASGYSPFNGTFNYIANLGSLGNKSLRWETTTDNNLGIDLEFFKGRLGFTVDLYEKITSDLLLNAPLPGSAGFSSGFKNIGKVSNRGLEISINTINIKNKNLTWTTNFNISFNQSKVLELAENQEYQYGFVAWNGNNNNTPLYIAKKGEALGEMFGYISDGVYQYSDFDKSPSGVYTLRSDVPTSFTTRSTLPVPGAIKLKDLNGDGVITPADRTVIGHGNPIHTGGITNNFTYKNFDLNIFFQWSYGNDIYNANRLIFENGSPNSSSSSLSMYKSYTNRWSPTNQTNDMPRANPGSPPGNYYWSGVVEDGSYLRLKTLSLGYSLSQQTVKKLKNAVSRLRVYVSAQNLLTFTNYSGFDPEVNGRPTALTPGFDYSVYPRANTITFGINATF